MTPYEHETFGPVVSIYTHRDVDEAVAPANVTSYGLNADAWSRNGARGRAVTARTARRNRQRQRGLRRRAGERRRPDGGGMGDSGLGRRHGAEGILKYTEPRTVAHQRIQEFTPPADISPETWAALLTGALRVLDAAGVR